MLVSLPCPFGGRDGKSVGLSNPPDSEPFVYRDNKNWNIYLAFINNIYKTLSQFN